MTKKDFCPDSAVVKRNIYNFLKSFQSFGEAVICISRGCTLDVTFSFILYEFGNLNSVSFCLTQLKDTFLHAILTVNSSCCFPRIRQLYDFSLAMRESCKVLSNAGKIECSTGKHRISLCVEAIISRQQLRKHDLNNFYTDQHKQLLVHQIYCHRLPIHKLKYVNSLNHTQNCKSSRQNWYSTNEFFILS